PWRDSATSGEARNLHLVNGQTNQRRHLLLGRRLTMNKCLSLDLETASEVDLKQCGIDVYARHPSTRVLMLAYAVDDGAVHQWFPHEGPMPAKLRAALTDSRYLKSAFNATFECAILKHDLGIDSPLDQWEDTM